MVTVAEVMHFWFQELTPEQRFAKDDKLDEEIRARFGELQEQAARGECFSWRETIEGRLAEIIVLDQFSRNIYRNDPRSFASDGMALVLAQEAIRTGENVKLPAEQRGFLYTPLMHAESLVIHEEAVKYFSEPGLEQNLEFEHRHRDIILRFGRYPHRNQILGRRSTADELAFLKEPGSSF